jgi:hypothetical protein
MLLLSLGVLINLNFDRDDPGQPLGALGLQPQTAYAAEPGAAQLVGSYSGEVELQFTVAGVFSETLNTQPPANPPDLGSIDLSLQLSQNGNGISGYVSLDKTLVFSTAHVLPNNNGVLKIGPYVNGSFDGTNLTLMSEQVAATIGGQPVKRQFRLTGAINASDGSQISGQYRETLWGATRQPVTVLGTFSLQRTVFPSGGPDGSNQPPTTTADTATTAPGTPVTINVLANDTDADGDPLTVTGVSNPQFGTATTDGQKVTYNPNVGFTGQDSFSYFVSDGQGHTTAGSVTVNVGGSGGPPGSNKIYLPLVRK